MGNYYLRTVKINENKNYKSSITLKKVPSDIQLLKFHIKLHEKYLQ